MHKFFKFIARKIENIPYIETTARKTGICRKPRAVAVSQALQIGREGKKINAIELISL